MRILAALSLFLIAPLVSAFEPPRISDSELAGRIHLPPGFEISVFARGLSGPRFMTVGPDQQIYVSMPGAGLVARLRSRSGGEGAQVERVVENLDSPHGLAFWRGKLYVAGTSRIWRVDQFSGGDAPAKIATVVAGLPDGGRGHWTRTILFGGDGKLYASIGSSCNACREKDPRRAAIVRYNPDGSGEEIFAKGLRNSVGIAWNPLTHELWGTDNGRDWLGDDLPPDEINIIRRGQNYGWPDCFGSRIPDPQFGSPEICQKTEPPAVAFPAHSAPLGLVFYTGKQFPEEYRANVFVAFHGSWNRSKKTGYKVVRVRLADGRPARVEDFATGWLSEQGGREVVWGRPVDPIVGPDGSLYLSDDFAGLIYRIRYKGKG